MGIDCSNCRCTNQDEEKILVIDHSYVIKNEKRKGKLDEIEKVQNSNSAVNNNVGYTNIIKVFFN